MDVLYPLGPDDGEADAVFRQAPSVLGVVRSHLTAYVQSLTDAGRAAIGHVCIVVYGGLGHTSDSIEVLVLPCGTGDIPSELLSMCEKHIRENILLWSSLAVAEPGLSVDTPGHTPAAGEAAAGPVAMAGDGVAGGGVASDRVAIARDGAAGGGAAGGDVTAGPVAVAGAAEAGVAAADLSAVIIAAGAVDHITARAPAVGAAGSSGSAASETVSLSDLARTSRGKILARGRTTETGSQGRKSAVAGKDAVTSVTPPMVRNFLRACAVQAMDQVTSPWLRTFFAWLRTQLGPSKGIFQWTDLIPPGLADGTWEWECALPGETIPPVRVTGVHLLLRSKNNDLMRHRVAVLVAAHLDVFWYQALFRFARRTDELSGMPRKKLSRTTNC